MFADGRGTLLPRRRTRVPITAAMLLVSRLVGEALVQQVITPFAGDAQVRLASSSRNSAAEPSSRPGATRVTGSALGQFSGSQASSFSRISQRRLKARPASVALARTRT